MKILHDLVTLLNKDNEENKISERLRLFSSKINRYSDDIPKVMASLEALYSELYRLNKESSSDHYPYLNDVVLCLIEIFDHVLKTQRKQKKYSTALHKDREKMRKHLEVLQKENKYLKKIKIKEHDSDEDFDLTSSISLD